MYGYRQEKYYHVEIDSKVVGIPPIARPNLTMKQLEARVLQQYKRGDPITLRGVTVLPSQIARIIIVETDGKYSRQYDSSAYLEGYKYMRTERDVTDSLITGPPGPGSRAAHQTSSEVRPSVDSREVFVIHGRNSTARDALFEFLRAIDLHPLEWSEAVSATGKASPYIGEILDAAFSRAHAVVVLFTPDDEVRLRQEFRGDGDLPHETELTGQARPNVLFEAGMAMGRHPGRTVLVELGDLRPFTDIAGLHVIRMDGSSQRRQELAQRLGTTGCPVKLDGTDWHTAGDFDATVVPTETESEGPDDHTDMMEETRFREMLGASRQLREHISQFLAPGNPNRTAFESQNIVIALGALASQMNALGMNELNERLELREDIRTKSERILAMLGYFEMHIVNRKFEKAKQEFASYVPETDDKGGYSKAENPS